MQYTVYSYKIEEVIKRLDRIAKKAEKYGVRFGYSVSEEHPVEVAVHDIDYVEHVQYVRSTYMVSAVDIDIDCDQFICSNGWTVLAKIEHGDMGNIVSAIGGAEINNAWYSAPARCDHCGTNRVRSVTFMVEKDGEIRQVGRSCLKDYTGIDPATALMWAQVNDIFGDDSCDYDSHEFRRALMYETVDILALACDEIKMHGYRKADSNASTKDKVAEAVKHNGTPTAEGTAKAKKIAEWLCSIDDNTVGLERDCKSLALSGWAKMAHIGRLCYMPIAYDKEMERREREAKRNAENALAAEQSDYVGNIGERITVKVAEMKIVTSWETQYGTTHLYKIVDEAGNVLMWKASGLLLVKGHGVDSIENIAIKCTVKEHNEYKGVKQTMVARCTAI